MHKIAEICIETIITLTAIFATAAVIVPSFQDLPVPNGTKIELICKPSHE